MFCWLFKKLACIFCGGCRGGPLQIVFKAPGINLFGDRMTISIVAGTAFALGLKLAPDASGNTNSTLPGPVTWTVDNAAMVLTPSADTTTVVGAVSVEGTYNVTATSGSLTTTQAITVTGGVTTGITIVEIPVPAPAPAAA